MNKIAHKIKQLLLTMVVAMISINAFTQQDFSNIPTAKLHRYAETARNMNDYYTLARCLETILMSEPTNKTLKKELAEAYFKTKNYKSSIGIYEELLEKENNQEASYQYWLAMGYKHTGQYKKAINYFDQCIKLNTDKNLARLSKIERSGCEAGLDSAYNFVEVNIYNMGPEINSRHLDFSPIALSDSLMLYASIKTDEMATYSLENQQNIPKSRFYEAKKNSHGWISVPQTMIEVNNPELNIGNGAFSPDRQRFYFTVHQRDWRNKDIAEMYYTKKKNNQWTEPVPISEVNLAGFTNTQPAVGNLYDDTREIIYFSSDRPDGIGGMDIWFTVYDKRRETFTEPKNVGKTINTPMDEITPFYNDTASTLYFSSNGQVGYGGFDIFKSIGSLRKWTLPANLSYPVNTHADETYYVLGTNQMEGFLASNRPGAQSPKGEYCCYDLYSYRYSLQELLKIQGKMELSLNDLYKQFVEKGLKFRQADSSDNVYSRYFEETEVALFVEGAENDTILLSTNNLNHEGEYKFLVDRNQDYQLVFSNNGEKQGELKISTKHIARGDTTPLTPDVVKVEFVPDEPLIIPNIQYEFNSSELSEPAKTTLDSTLIPVLIKNKEVAVEINAYTDNIGDKKFNQNLSQQRAGNVVLYLSQKGVESHRLQARGHGDSDPIAPNQFADGSDNPEGREKNRRTEFKIITTKTPAASGIKFK